METSLRSKKMSEFILCEKDVAILLKVEFSTAYTSLRTISALSKMRDINFSRTKLDWCVLKMKHFKDPLFLILPLAISNFNKSINVPYKDHHKMDLSISLVCFTCAKSVLSSSQNNRIFTASFSSMKGCSRCWGKNRLGKSDANNSNDLWAPLISTTLANLD